MTWLISTTSHPKSVAENIPDSCYSSPDTFGDESGFNEKKI